MSICEITVAPRFDAGVDAASPGWRGMALRGESGVTRRKCFVFLIDDGGWVGHRRDRASSQRDRRDRQRRTCATEKGMVDERVSGGSLEGAGERLWEGWSIQYTRLGFKFSQRDQHETGRPCGALASKIEACSASAIEVLLRVRTWRQIMRSGAGQETKETDC